MRPADICVDNINGNKQDNRSENLRWCSFKLNSLYHFQSSSKNYYYSHARNGKSKWRVKVRGCGNKWCKTEEEARRYAMELKAKRLAEAEAEFAQMIAEYRSQQDNALGTD